MPPANVLTSYLGKLESSLAFETATDGQLVECFVRQREERAFAVLVQRHGPMVWGVCRRILVQPQDAEDAFQATFLILLQKTQSISPPGMVGNWLYGVAVRAAHKARTNRARRDAKERRAAEMKPDATSDAAPTADLKELLDRELSALPDKYRAPIVLCDLQGRTREQATKELGWPAGSVAGRLARARELLARRLSRRGIGVTGAALATALVEQSAASALPPQLVVTTTKLAAAFAAGQLSAAVSPQIITLTKGVIHTMFVTKLKGKLTILAIVLCAGLGTGGAAVALSNGDKDPPAQLPADNPKENKNPKREEDPNVIATKQLQGTWDMAALESNGESLQAAALAGASIQMDGDRFISNMNGIVYKGTVKIDATKKPMTLDMIFTDGPEKGVTSLAIFEIKDDLWKLCIDMTGKARPTEFSAKAGNGCVLETLKRRKADTAKAKDDMAQLEGEWTMESGERDGQAFPKEMVQTMKRVATDGETTVTMAGQRFMRAKYTVDATQKPKTIDYVLTDGPDIGKKQLGIYELEGDTVKFCFAPVGTERPKDFATKSGDGRTTTIWKRVKK